jgi:DNA-nicking Smr family endonuclease
MDTAEAAFTPAIRYNDPKRHDMDEMNETGILDLPIDGILDLHTFLPGEAKELVADYLSECRERGILTVRIIHGKGRGQLRRTVHAVLARSPEVASFRPAGEDAGGWGATIVELKLKGLNGLTERQEEG